MNLEDEVRCGYTVTAKMKRVWAVELEILEVFDAVCKKHNLKYYADYGTLLGAVRHKGFIPWDDDIDVVMFRKDYQKLKEVIRDELTEPFVFQDWYSDMFFHQSFSKIRHNRTTAIEQPDVLEAGGNQGIFIDIFPFDDIADGVHLDSFVNEMQLAMWFGMSKPEILQKPSYARLRTLLQSFLNLPLKEQLWTFEELCFSYADTSDIVNYFCFSMEQPKTNRRREWYQDIIYMPFEDIQIPCPAGYHDILTCSYGNYMEPVMGGSLHEGIFWDPDRPYTDYRGQFAKQKMEK